MVNWSKLEIVWDEWNENHSLKHGIKKWKDVSPKDVTSKPNWEEGWRLEHGNVVKVHKLWGEAKLEEP